MSKNILIVGGDLTSNGGIASVIKSQYNAYLKAQWPFKIYLLKTNHYKDKPLFFEILILIKAFYLCFYYILFKKVKILHIHTSANISFFRKSIFVIIGKLTGRKVILHLHSSDFYRFFLTKKPVLRSFISFILNRADSVIVLCKDWEQKMRTAYHLNTLIKIENPIDLNEINSVNETKLFENETFKISFVGFLIESKGIKDLLEAVLRLRNDGLNNILLKIAGKGELEKYILDFIDTHELYENIEYIGWISGESKVNLYKSTDLFILPSYKEGMPISILEAMSFGLPVISTRIAGIPDVITQERNGFLFEPGDIDELVQLIKKCYNNTVNLKTISNTNLEDVKRFSSEKIFNKVVEVYNDLL